MSNIDRPSKLMALKQRDSVNRMRIVSNGEAFIDVLDATVDEIKESMSKGIPINNLDDLIERLEIIQAFHQEVKELKTVVQGIKDIQIPDTVSLEGLADLIKAIKDRPIPKIINKIINTEVIDEYQVANSDELDDANSYYGYVHPTGKWYVYWISGGLTDSAFKYSTGTENYTSGWSRRKRLSYKRFDEVSL